MKKADLVRREEALVHAIVDSIEGMSSAEDALDHIIQVTVSTILDSQGWEEPCLERTIARCFWRMSRSYFEDYRNNSDFYRNYQQEQKQ